MIRLEPLLHRMVQSRQAKEEEAHALVMRHERLDTALDCPRGTATGCNRLLHKGRILPALRASARDSGRPLR